ncbi:hypothetical protein [Horticoccus sp. 23ND18S-11]|uniref:hypothetical protein n=1 Tax=Horticoccus sp. 23ND18S-11 TaxID=3391832 RepID=UPI0039C8D11E
MHVSSQDPLATFVAGVVQQNACIASGDARRGKRESKKYVAAARTLLAGGKDEVDRFATLLTHDHDDVRVMAAAFLLKDRTELAVAALRPLAKGGGIAALGARMTLERYERGDLEIR